MQQKWKKWTPELENVPEKLYLKELKDNYDGLTLLFKLEKEDSKYLKVFFDAALSYRNTDEGDLLKSMYCLSHDESIESPRLFFTVENSQYLKWFHDESYNIRADEHITHYVFVTPDDVVDVLALDAPSFNWVAAII